MFHKMAFALSVFLRQNHLIKSTPDVRRELAHAFQEFAHFTSDVKEYLTIRCLGMPTILLYSLSLAFDLGTNLNKA